MTGITAEHRISVPFGGRANGVLVPGLEAANVLVARVPTVLTSRDTSWLARMAACVITPLLVAAWSPEQARVLEAPGR